MKTNKTILKIPTEIYSRVVGFFRPVNQWNKGKREEFRQRKTYSLDVSFKEKEEEL